MCIYHAIAKSNTLPLDNKETPSIVLLHYHYHCIIICIVFLHIVIIDILIKCCLIAEY